MFEDWTLSAKSEQNIFNNQEKIMMRQRIFDLQLSVETTSLYLLFEGLSADKSNVSTQEIFKVWNSTEALFKKGLEELEEKKIIARVLADSEHNGYYRLVNNNRLQCACGENSGINGQQFIRQAR